MSTDVNISPSEQTSKWIFSAQVKQLAELLEQPKVLNTVLVIVLVTRCIAPFYWLELGRGASPSSR